MHITKTVLIKKFYLLIISTLIGVFSSYSQVYQQDCNSLSLSIDTLGSEINWEQFPNFSLPFTVVYHGNAPSDSILYPLSKGFSHIGGKGIDYIDVVTPEHRAYTWTNVINPNGWAIETSQPWVMIKSPWGNNINGYRYQWTEHLNWIKENWYKTSSNFAKGFDIVIADIEWTLKEDSEILGIKYDTLVPEYYQEMTDSVFIAEYKLAMAELYAEPLQLARDILNTEVKITSYSETPIPRTWSLIDNYEWNEWKTDSTLIDFMMNDTLGFMNSNFYQLNDLIAPSAYYFHNVDSIPVGLKYLAYNLFHIEANMAWSNKDQLEFVWLNYHPCCSVMEAIKPWMAEATAIFPFMDGVRGLYPWIPVSYDSYEYFIYGLYRLSAFSYFFNGEQTYVVPESAHSSFINNTPIWRAVVNGDEILIAAHNPFAAPTDTTFIPVAYNYWSETIAVIGKETFLCNFSLNPFDVVENDFIEENIKVYPNPSDDKVFIEGVASACFLTVYQSSGKIVQKQKEIDLPLNIDISKLDDGVYFLKIENIISKEQSTIKIIKK